MAIEWAYTEDEDKRFCTDCFRWVSAPTHFTYTSEAWSKAACGECWDKWVIRKGKHKRVRHPRRRI